ncbi:C6 transcription factor [Colletotrichum kahawae]|uniref:C6 transcription factor n=1 Tax=Colletotrichum kahawae TaxID=34407 RepID=A0AAD9YN16_COLKA|nr:C6 transcription factor [Colletotrichum kahawae]
MLSAPCADYFSFGPDWDIGTVDFSFIQAQFELGDTNIMSGDVSDNCEDSLVPLGTQRKNVALSEIWEPKSHENNEMERQNLAVGEEAFDASCSIKATGNRITKLCVSPAIRSKVVGMILRTTSESRSAEVLGCFPGCQALSSLLDIYSDYWEVTQIYDFVHLPTLDICKQAPELLGALIAIGALEADSTVVRKFGYAMQEVVRASAFDSWEGNNTAVCDISLAQGFLLQQQIAFFSGVRRKVALAEACSKAVEVLIKNGGHMKGARQTDCRDLSTIMEAHGDTLDGLWRQWSVRESQRRLVYASYILDAHVSMSHGTQMISTYVDMDMPLPAPNKLWKASSATQWRDEIVALHVAHMSEPRSSICLTELMAQPLSNPAVLKDVDSDFAIFAFLAGVWALCMECHQLSFVLGQSSTWSHMILSSRRNELCCITKAFASQLKLAEVPIPAEMEVLFEVMIMHTLTQGDTPALRHLAFSRLESSPTGQNSSPKPSLSTEHCHALWRAGRVIRAARNCPRGKLCGVSASSLFQAVLLLWRHGQSCHTFDGSALPTCIIDGDGCQEHHVLAGNTRLAVSGVRSEPVFINSTVFGESIREVVEKNWEGKYMPLSTAGICDSLSNISSENKDH